MPFAQRTVHDEFVVRFHFELRILGLEQLQNVRRHFLAQIHPEQFAVMDAAIVVEVQDKSGHRRLAGDIADQFVFFADSGGGDLFHGLNLR